MRSDQQRSRRRRSAACRARVRCASSSGSGSSRISSGNESSTHLNEILKKRHRARHRREHVEVDRHGEERDAVAGGRGRVGYAGHNQAEEDTQEEEVGAVGLKGARVAEDHKGVPRTERGGGVSEAARFRTTNATSHRASCVRTCVKSDAGYLREGKVS